MAASLYRLHMTLNWFQNEGTDKWNLRACVKAKKLSIIMISDPRPTGIYGLVGYVYRFLGLLKPCRSAILRPIIYRHGTTAIIESTIQRSTGICTRRNASSLFSLSLAIKTQAIKCRLGGQFANSCANTAVQFRSSYVKSWAVRVVVLIHSACVIR